MISCVVCFAIVPHDCMADLVQALLNVDQLVLIVERNEPIEFIDELLLGLQLSMLVVLVLAMLLIS